MPRVSVIIPTFNRAHLLGATLESVRAQTFADYEIILVDDGSTDDTSAQFKNSRDPIRYLQTTHAGQGVARNFGMASARGEYIAFLDSDDLWHARFLEKMTAALEANQSVGLVYCDYATFDSSGIIAPAYLPPEHKLRGNIFPTLLESNFISTGALLIRRECFERVGGFDASLPLVEDWDLWLRLARLYGAQYVDEPLAQIRIDLSHTSRNPEMIYRLNLRVLAKLRREFPQDAKRFRLTLRGQNARFHGALAAYFRRSRRPLPACKHLLLMLAARFS